MSICVFVHCLKIESKVFLFSTRKRSVPRRSFSLLGKVHVSLRDCVQQLISLFRSLCVTLGKPYSDKKVRENLHLSNACKNLY